MSVDIILSIWKRLSTTRFGRKLFSYLVRFFNPYTGRLGAQVEVLEPGYAEITLKDIRRNRNHLNSVHAIALSNLGEFTSGIAVLVSLDTKTRGIVTHISVDFFKKARGELRAISRCELPCVDKEMEFKVYADIFDQAKDKVARVDVTWKLGRKT